MESLIIKCDIDNVLNNLVVCMFDMYNERNGTNLTYDDCVEYDFSCFSSDIYADLYKMFDEKEMWDRCKPVKNSAAYLKKINDEFDLLVVTATNTNNFQWKVEWMKKYFPFLKEDQIWRDDGKHRRLIWSDFSIDDYAENLKGDYGYKILIDAPWNKNERCDNVNYFRAKDLKDAYEFIRKKIKEEKQ